MITSFQKFLIHSFFIFLLISCHSLSPRAVTSESNEMPIYETVNSLPQFADDDTHFLLYWSVWRRLSNQEKQALGNKAGALLSERDIRWTVVDCQTHSTLNSAGEQIWYLDDIDFNTEGKVKPIIEAPRIDYRYLNMINLNSQHLRGAGPFIAPKKLREETVDEWNNRRHKAYLEWEKKSWAKGTRGEVIMKAEHRLHTKESVLEDRSWVNPQDYPKATGEILDWITKLSSRRWPIYFDERAHKPHQFTEPKSWHSGNQAISHNKFRMRFSWNWCNAAEPVQVEIFFPRGEMPPPGPNRPGRTDSGQKSIKITEIEWPETGS